MPTSTTSTNPVNHHKIPQINPDGSAHRGPLSCGVVDIGYNEGNITPVFVCFFNGGGFHPLVSHPVDRWSITYQQEHIP